MNPRKVFERVLYVDYEYNPEEQMPPREEPKERTSRGSYEAVMHAVLGDCVYWGLEPFGYHKKIRVTVELLGDDSEDAEGSRK